MTTKRKLVLARAAAVTLLAAASAGAIGVANADKPAAPPKSQGSTTIGLVKLPASVGGVSIGLVKLPPKK